MKAAFALVLLALSAVPAGSTVRIMVWRKRKRRAGQEG